MDMTWVITLFLLCATAALAFGVILGYVWGASERKEEQQWESIEVVPGDGARLPGKQSGPQTSISEASDGKWSGMDPEIMQSAAREELRNIIAEIPKLAQWTGDQFDRALTRLRAEK
ncbi:MAG TPA: hypothetical protein VE733_02865 [Streptosporangiaceae bacterium]|jgi:hypothetical protein|nr:hypothetical protein [Streptosporangiaceae bacterium]